MIMPAYMGKQQSMLDFQIRQSHAVLRAQFGNSAGASATAATQKLEVLGWGTNAVCDLRPSLEFISIHVYDQYKTITYCLLSIHQVLLEATLHLWMPGRLQMNHPQIWATGCVVAPCSYRRHFKYS